MEADVKRILFQFSIILRAALKLYGLITIICIVCGAHAQTPKPYDSCLVDELSDVAQQYHLPNLRELTHKRPATGVLKSRDALREENATLNRIVKELDLTKDQRRELHDGISGQHLNYDQILEHAKALFGIP